jgi:uncharacterized surface protein with fasciclin (FAS1) repeats
MKRFGLVVALLGLVVAASTFGATDALQSCKDKSIWDLIQEDSKLSKLAYAIKRTGLDEFLSGDKPKVTLFAPDNEAISEVPHEASQYFSNKDFLEVLHGILLYHVVEDTVKSDDIKDKDELETIEGEPLKTWRRHIGDNATIVSVNAASIKKADIKASNGVIHIIDSGSSSLGEHKQILRKV